MCYSLKIEVQLITFSYVTNNTKASFQKLEPLTKLEKLHSLLSIFIFPITNGLDDFCIKVIPRPGFFVECEKNRREMGNQGVLYLKIEICIY